MQAAETQALGTVTELVVCVGPGGTAQAEPSAPLHCMLQDHRLHELPMPKLS